MKTIEVQGIISNIDTMAFYPAMLQVGISNDALGRSISIASDEYPVMYQIPFDAVEKYLERQ